MGSLRQPGHGFGQQVDAGAARHVVDHDGNLGLGRHGLVVLIEPFLGGLVVVRSDHQGRIRPRGLGVLGQLQGFGGIVGAGPGDHHHPFFHLVDAGLHHPFVLGVGQGGGFAGGAAGHDAVDASLNLELDELPVGRFIKLAVLEGSDDGGDGSLEHGGTSLLEFVDPQFSLVDHQGVAFQVDLGKGLALGA